MLAELLLSQLSTSHCMQKISHVENEGQADLSSKICTTVTDSAGPVNAESLVVVMQAIRTNVEVPLNYANEHQKLTCFFDINVALHAKCVAMFTSIEQGCGQFDKVVDHLVSRLEAKLAALCSDKPNVRLYLIMVISAFDEQVMNSVLLTELLEVAVGRLSAGRMACEPVWWLWIGAHGRPRWMPWEVNPSNLRAPDVVSKYKYPWAN